MWLCQPNSLRVTKIEESLEVWEVLFNHGSASLELGDFVE